MTLPINLVADIGGTNLRIGTTDEKGVINNIALYQCNQFSGLAEIIEDYLSTD